MRGLLTQQVIDTVRAHGRARLSDVVAALPDQNSGSVSSTLKSLVKRGRLRRVAKNLYEVVPPITKEAVEAYMELETTIGILTALEIRLLTTRGPKRYNVREQVRADVEDLLHCIRQDRVFHLTQGDPSTGHVYAVLDLMEARANSLLQTVDRLEREDPRPAPLRGGRGRPAKYSA